MSDENLRATRSSRNNHRKKKKKKSIWLKLLIVFLIILALGIGSATAVFYTMYNNVDNVKLNTNELGVTTKEELDKYDNYKKIINIALLGIDSQDGVGRSDSIMIATIDPVHNKLKITSVMRDSYVDIDGHGYDKINHAYAFGGPALTIKTLNQTFGLNIENFIAVDFTTLPIIIDTIGGVEININEEEFPYVNQYIRDINRREGTTSPQLSYTGLQTLNGVQALAYSRIRYTAGGDSERTQRQRTVLNQVFEKSLSVSPTQYPNIINSLLPYVKTNLSATDVLSIATKAASIGATSLEQERFPRDGSSWSEPLNGVYYLNFDKEATKQQMMDYIFDDKK